MIKKQSVIKKNSSMIKKKQLQETVHSTLLLGCFNLLYMLYSNLYRVFCFSCLVCIFLSYVYLLHFFFIYFRRRTAG